jgi:N utilization substance protein B
MPAVKATNPRRQARIVALQCLFAADISENPAKSSLEWLVAENPLPQKMLALAQRLILGATDHRPELDEVIQRYAPTWPVSQIALVDRNVLRLALFELFHCADTPRKTAINEAVELAKVFGSESSARFVNGVLGSVMAGLEAGELTPDKTAAEGR